MKEEGKILRKENYLQATLIIIGVAGLIFVLLTERFIDNPSVDYGAEILVVDAMLPISLSLGFIFGSLLSGKIHMKILGLSLIALSIILGNYLFLRYRPETGNANTIIFSLFFVSISIFVSIVISKFKKSHYVNIPLFISVVSGVVAMGLIFTGAFSYRMYVEYGNEENIYYSLNLFIGILSIYIFYVLYKIDF